MNLGCYDMEEYTLGLFANLYPRYEGDSHGVFVKRMVDSLERKNVKVIRSVKSSLSPIAYFPFYADSFVKLLKSDIDILQAEYIPHSSIMPSIMKFKRPLILRFHGDDGLIYPFKNQFNRKLIQLSIKRADHITTCSEALKQSLISLGTDPDKITAIANGVDTSKFHPMNKNNCRRQFNLPDDELICLYAGRLHPMKGIFELVKAAEKYPNVNFVFAGPGTIPPHPKNCFFLGDIDPDRMPILMNCADFFALPTHSEGLGLVLLESLSCGVPVIASNVGGCPEVVEDGRSGILIQPKSVESLSNGIEMIISDDHFRDLAGKYGRKTVCSRYDANLMTDKLMEIHFELINK